LTDHELAKRLASGDPEAVAAMVRTHHPALYRFLYQLTRSREDAEDLAIQTLQRAREAASRYDGRASMSTWLHRIAFHEFTRWRRRRRWHLGLRSVPPVEDPRFGAVIEAEWLLDALSKLPDGMRAAFLLHEVQGLSVPEVAITLGVPEGTVKSKLYHARERLRERLGNDAVTVEKAELVKRNEVFES
jgi:RNA polymerase sigma-70 factor (ECF subfamily)